MIRAVVFEFGCFGWLDCDFVLGLVLVRFCWFGFGFVVGLDDLVL